MASFTIRNLTFSYPDQETKVLDDISLSIEPGEFVTLCGPSGCGKTTLLRQLKSVLAPHGKRSGEILFGGRPLSDLDQREQSSKIGFVLQSPDNQIVTDKVWHELAFGLESLGFDTPSIRRRVAEMASFFGIQDWFYKDVTDLSGGQKQMLNLASIMVMQPSVLILDEPTSQLDPIAAGDFLTTVAKIHRELGTTVLMTEHRLEEVLPLTDRVLVLDQGKIICDGGAQEVGSQLKEMHHSMFLAMPVPMRIYAGVKNDLPCPVTVQEGRTWLDNLSRRQRLEPGAIPTGAFHQPDGTPALEFEEVWFRYDKEAPDVLKGFSMKVFPGEFYALVGGNGTGKTTALSLVPGINKPYRGRVCIMGKETWEIPRNRLFDKMVGVLPQNPQALFVKKTLKEDLLEVLSDQKLAKEEKIKKVEEVSSLCRLENLLSTHPYDLSGGEQQRAALAKVLLLEPKILLLDEPTKGMDGEFKGIFAGILKKLLQKGATILMVSHDIEFCARYAHRCGMVFDGHLVSDGDPRQFFSGNNFYTTAANRMARQQLPNAVVAEDVIAACGGDLRPLETLPPKKQDSVDKNFWQEATEVDIGPPGPIAPIRRRKIVSGFVFLILAGIIGVKAMGDISGLVYGPRGPINLIKDGSIWGYFFALLSMSGGLGLLYNAFQGRKPPIENEQVAGEKRYLPRRTLMAMVVILFTIPLTIYIGVYYLYDRKYYFISLLILLQTMLPFILVFESRKPQARELIIIAVLSALGVAGRGAFFMLPQFKPVVALVIISGVAFGGEAGFLVGAITGFASNVFFGQGPWTPWQMFGFGIIGFLAGVLFQKGILQRSTLSLCVFGGLATFFIYGGIMNPASVLMFQERPRAEMFLLAYLRGIPFDLVHATATVVFLWFGAQPMLEKLDRIKVKYGLISGR